MNIQAKVDATVAFIKKNYLFVFALGLVFIFLLIVFISSSNPDTNTPQPNQNSGENPSPTIEQIVTLDDPEITWSPLRFSENTLSGVDATKTTLADGSTKYTYSSSNPNRPNEMVVKSGVVTYQRVVITDRYIYDYTNDLEAPDYVFQSSRFYGSNTMTYVYLNRGTAFVADAETTLVKEQISFKPTSLEDFKQKYGEDIADFTVIPTLPDEDFATP